ncbi:MAG: arylamine N-acetyltransferase [Streptosporangiaceae bacterium]
MDRSQADSYLSRIGGPDPRSLADLQWAHQRTVPFENLSIHLGEQIVLDPKLLFDKIMRGRGGFCYELNSTFGALLTALGYQVDLLAARVFGEDGTPGAPFEHLVLRVDGVWLVDVGFGRFSRSPLRLDDETDQADADGLYRVTADLVVHQDGTPQYRYDPKPYELRDFVPTCWYQATSPASPFTRSLTCSLPWEGGRITLSGDRLITTRDGTREEIVLAGDQDILRTYRDVFGITLPRVPALRG